MSKRVVLPAFAPAFASLAAACCLTAMSSIAPSVAADLSVTPYLKRSTPGWRGADGMDTVALPSLRTGRAGATGLLPPAAVDPALLELEPLADCEFKGPVGRAPTSEEIRQKLDYEAQCYRQAREIVAERLLTLQGAVNNAIRRSRPRGNP
jgi:hypothetical protein